MVEGYRESFGSAADGSGDVAMGDGGVSSGEDEVFKGGQRFLHFIHFLLEEFNVLGSDVGGG